MHIPVKPDSPYGRIILPPEQRAKTDARKARLRAALQACRDEGFNDEWDHIIEQNDREKAAFTLIELLVVIAIIAILAAIFFPVFAQARAAARRTVCISNITQINAAILAYSQDYDESYPATWVATYIKKGSVLFDLPKSMSKHQSITGYVRVLAGKSAESKIVIGAPRQGFFKVLPTMVGPHMKASLSTDRKNILEIGPQQDQDIPEHEDENGQREVTWSILAKDEGKCRLTVKVWCVKPTPVGAELDYPKGRTQDVEVSITRMARVNEWWQANSTKYIFGPLIGLMVVAGAKTGWNKARGKKDPSDSKSGSETETELPEFEDDESESPPGETVAP